MQTKSVFAFGALSAAVLCNPVCAQTTSPSGQGFNPKISLILNGLYADYSSDAESDVGGVLLGGETEFAPEGFSIGESELAIESNIDDQFHGWITVAFENEDGETVVGIEEAYVDTLALPYGLAAKFGRFFSDIGYQNRQHAHAWSFVDAPLVYRALLGNQLGDDGAQLRWVAPTDQFIELGGEVFRGDAFPSGGDDRTGVGAWSAFAHFGGDIGTSASWLVGFWHYDGDAQNRISGEDFETSFTGSSRINGIDLVYKWAENGNPALRNLVVQAELMQRSERGQLIADPEGSADTSAYDGEQLGWYVQGVYQFRPRWRAGLRYDRLGASNDVDNAVSGTPLETLADDDRDPQKWSAMIDFSNSEFSSLRLQYSRDESRPGGEADNQIFVQYIFSLGAHPAHQF